MNFYSTISAKETNQINKQTNSNLLSLTVSCQKSSCLIRSKTEKEIKKKTNKMKQNKTKTKNSKNKNKDKKQIKKGKKRK